MINIDNVKIAVFDFDDTLCIHKYHGSTTRIPNFMQKCLEGNYPWNQYDQHDDEYGSPSSIMRVFIKMCEHRGIPMFVCSATNMSVIGKSKTDWVNFMYQCSMENICVSSWDKKAEMMLELARYHNVGPDEVLVIDDYFAVLDMAGDLGFQTATPIEVSQFLISSGFTFENCE